MSFIHCFGMEFNPFEKNNKLEIIETSDHKEMMFRLNFLTESKGIGLFYGPPGIGKTTSLRKYVSTLNPMKYKVIYIQLSTITVHEFYRALAEELGVIAENKKLSNFKSIQAEIVRLQKEKKITPVIILDEAQYLKTEVLLDLKLLLNFEMDSINRVVLILNGTPMLSSVLNKPIHEALKQRIIISYDYHGINLEELKLYIDTKLKESKCELDIMTPQAYNAILNCSNASLRTVNDLMTKCLIILSNAKEKVITTDVVMLANNDRVIG